MGENAFNLFINLKPCTNAQFRKALEYYEGATIEEKLKFKAAIRKICFKAYMYLVKNKTANLNKAKEIYSKYGIGREYFRKCFYSIFGVNTLKNAVSRKKSAAERVNIEKLYKQIDEAFWDYTLLACFARKAKMPIEDFNKELFKYANNNLGINEENFRNKILVARVTSSVLNGKYTQGCASQVFTFYSLYANDMQKNAIDIFFKNLFLNIKKKIKDGKSINDICLELNMNLSILNNFILQFANKDEELVTYFFKKYFLDAEEIKWNVSKLYNLAKINNDIYNNICKGAILYGSLVLGLDMPEHIKKVRYLENLPSSIYANILTQVLNEEDPDKIYSFLDGKGVAISHITNFCYGRNKYLPREEQARMEKDLLKKLKTFWESRDKQLREKRKAASTLTDESIAKGKDLSKVQMATLKFKELAKYIKNGITDENGIRPFDYIDMFLTFKNTLDPTRSFHTIKDLTEEERTILSKYLAPFKFATRFNKESFINSYYEVNLQKDEDGNLIPGSGYILSEDEKIAIVKFIEDNNLPKYEIILSNVISRYLEKALTITTLQSGRA